jgi:hypothetical protein
MTMQATRLPDEHLVLPAFEEKLGPIESAPSSGQMRDHLENLHGSVGINALYDFRYLSGRGIGEGGAAVVRYNPTTIDFAVVSKPGGHIK